MNERDRYSGIWRRQMLFVVVAGLSGAACNTARYGIRYNQRLPCIKSIAVVPLAISVQALHTGGVPEPRPDLSDAARDRLIPMIRELITDHGATPVVLPTDTGPASMSASQQRVLEAAVENAILTHHYQFGKQRMIDYGVGPRAAGTHDESVGAILCVRLDAVVPTKGRVGLAVTAVIISGLTGISIGVGTHAAALTLMLIDAESGDVLWFNTTRMGVDVRSDRALKSLVRRTGRYFLKPMKE